MKYYWQRGPYIIWYFGPDLSESCWCWCRTPSSWVLNSHSDLGFSWLWTQCRIYTSIDARCELFNLHTVDVSTLFAAAALPRSPPCGFCQMKSFYTCFPVQYSPRYTLHAASSTTTCDMWAAVTMSCRLTGSVSRCERWRARTFLSAAAGRSRPYGAVRKYVWRKSVTTI